MNNFTKTLLVFFALVIIITTITLVVWRVSSSGDDKKEDTVEEVEHDLSGEASIIVSNNKGVTWHDVPRSQDLKPRIFVFRTNNTDQIYVGTDNDGLWVRESGSQELLRVNDSKDVLKNNSDITAIAQNASGTKLYVALFQDNFGRLLEITENGILEVFTMSQPKLGIFGVIVDLNDASHITMTTGDGSVFESTNSGESWAVISRTGEGIALLEAHKEQTGVLWAVGNKGAFYSTTNGGREWTKRLPITIDRTRIKSVNVIKHHSSRGSLLAATDYGLIETYDNGKTWEAFKTPITPGTIPITAIGIHPRSGNIFWMAAEKRIWKTSTGGVTWEEIRLPLQESVSFIELNPTNPDIIYVGLSK
ncbi:MAG: hypothetical protein O2794_01465 [bacterium]|nr:hypothetical protein [bacterium]